MTASAPSLMWTPRGAGSSPAINISSDEFKALATAIAKVLSDRRAVIDGEIVCLDAEGRPHFYELLSRKGKPYYYAFDCSGSTERTCEIGRFSSAKQS